MPNLSSAGWIAHDVGLATSIGGAMFGRWALEPALHDVSSPRERDGVSEVAWRRFSWLNLAAHVAFAVPWFVGRSMLSGREVGARGRALTRTKDMLVGASLITGVATMIIGRILGKRVRRGAGPEQARAGDARREASASPKLERTVGLLGFGNLLATLGVAAVTALLAMEASKSVRFAVESRRLP